MKFLLAILFVSIAASVSAQSSKKKSIECKPNYDSTQAVELVLATYDTARIPVAKLDKQACEWTVTFFTAAYTRKGNCKNTNGCTIITNYVATIDARTGKMDVEMTERKTIANWE